jgi:hypothetical protein
LALHGLSTATPSTTWKEKAPPPALNGWVSLAEQRWVSSSERHSFDSTGAEVPKTSLGKQRGLPLTIPDAGSSGAGELSRTIKGLMGVGDPLRSRRLRPVFVSAKDATELSRFGLNELFDIKSPGQYRLTYQQRIYQLDPTNKLTGLTLPLVVAPVEVRVVPE